MQAMLTPQNDRAIKTALATPGTGIDEKRLRQISEDDQTWGDMVALFQHAATLWHRDGILRAFAEIDRKFEVICHLLTLPQGARLATNHRHILECLNQAEADQQPGASCSVELDAPGRTAFTSDRAKLRLDNDGAAVKIVTVHKSKGLEYGIVYCPFLGYPKTLQKPNEKWPVFRSSSSGQATLVLLPDGDLKNEALEEIKSELFQESLRLLYVALTRAKHQVVIYADVNGKSFTNSALAHMLLSDETSQKMSDQTSENSSTSQKPLSTTQIKEIKKAKASTCALTLQSLASRQP